ncbi:TIGR00730 family Rossman fold protein [Nordella sp. HKS 07]|uniref:LOG family protein n=1 Tax=Nordella sp. HKS 07 TaxID=2712222 RepID=UPI0013E116FB|nr:TIGR00730 family Rossman fold protein [Nordella sp. HKS 07]QIG50162.1 TIGR00730 family Rossman fold protein [Nordella sp. HKS 07]
MRHLCVYCGSGPGRNPAYIEAARTLGAVMADRGIGLVYGGGGLGLMGEVARAVIAGGGHVVGIIPEFLVNKERMLTDVNELIVTASMHERKMTMFERSDGFVALPGGLGTLEELVEISTWAQLGRHAKPIIICDIDNYWAPLLTLINHMRQEKFIREGIDLRLEVVKKPADVVSVFEDRLQHSTANVPADPIRKTL